MKKHKILAILLTLILIITLLSSCGNNGSSNIVNDDNSQSTDVTSILSGNKHQNGNINNVDNIEDDTSSVDLGNIGNIEDSNSNQGNKENQNLNSNSDDSLDIGTILDGILKIKVIDCGQADSILIHNDEYNILIDAGEQKTASSIKKVLDNLGVKKIDLLIATHPHADHIGGMQTIVEEYEIDAVMMYPTEHSTQTYTNLLEAISNKGCKTIKATPGNEYTYGDIKLKVVSPSETYKDLNDNSVVVLLSYGDIDMLLTGDASMDSEKDYVSYLDDSIEILKVGHHGSDTATSDNLLDTIKPDVAIISCGLNNKYGHPTEEVLNKLSKRGIDTFRTDLQGEITVTTNGKDYAIDTVNYGEIAINKNDDNYTTSSIENNNTDNNTENNQTNTVDSNAEAVTNGSGQTVYVASKGTKYHSRETCRSLLTARDISTMTEQEAINNGLDKCKNCW